MTDRHALVAQLHDAPLSLVLAVTGGGVAAIGDLLAVPGASRTVLEVSVPYAEQALSDLIGESPEQAVSSDTARAMAVACLKRAQHLGSGEVAGVGCTAALVTDRPKRGDHRAHVCVATSTNVATWSITLDKGRRDRTGEDRVVADLVLRAIAMAAGVEGPEVVPAT
ncbi:MAG: nicotinamide mononucleotide (NMN) deamidase PncC [Candidatus Poriferisodalaceae bacterium]|jgi:nicotinamide mononucleotide (NMN) deamidase PncC